MNTVTIARQTVPQTAALAPMASVADTAYRTLCAEHGACMTTGELVSAKGLCYGSRGSAELCRITQAERPMGLQLFGSEPEFISEAVQRLLDFQPDWIDLNMGCPVPKVVNQGAGSALMKTPELAGECLKAAVRAADGKCAVTVKMRIGWDAEHINAVDFAKRMEAEGAEASKTWYCHAPKGHFNYPDGVADNSHLSQTGAARVAEMIAEALKEDRIW